MPPSGHASGRACTQGEALRAGRTPLHGQGTGGRAWRHPRATHRAGRAPRARRYGLGARRYMGRAQGGGPGATLRPRIGQGVHAGRGVTGWAHAVTWAGHRGAGLGPPRGHASGRACTQGKALRAGRTALHGQGTGGRAWCHPRATHRRRACPALHNQGTSSPCAYDARTVGCACGHLDKPQLVHAVASSHARYAFSHKQMSWTTWVFEGMPLIPRDAASSLVCSAVPAVHTIAQCTQSHSLLQTWCKWSPVCAQCSAKAKGSCASAFRCVSAFRPAHVCICLDNIAGVQVCVQRGTQYVCKELGACKRELLLASSSCCITPES